MQNLTFADGNSTGETTEGGGGGAIFVRGGRFKVSTPASSATAATTGPDLGGAAIRVLSQYHGRPVYVVGSTFTRRRAAPTAARSAASACRGRC